MKPRKSFIAGIPQAPTLAPVMQADASTPEPVVEPVPGSLGRSASEGSKPVQESSSMLFSIGAVVCLLLVTGFFVVWPWYTSSRDKLCSEDLDNVYHSAENIVVNREEAKTGNGAAAIDYAAALAKLELSKKKAREHGATEALIDSNEWTGSNAGTAHLRRMEAADKDFKAWVYHLDEGKRLLEEQEKKTDAIIREANAKREEYFRKPYGTP